jgi:hypothetical protein
MDKLNKPDRAPAYLCEEDELKEPELPKYIISSYMISS